LAGLAWAAIVTLLDFMTKKVFLANIGKGDVVQILRGGDRAGGEIFSTIE